MNFLAQRWKKFTDLVNQDIRYEDESKQFAVMIRVNQLILIGYFVLFELLSLLFWKGGNYFLILPWIAALVLGLATTYYFRSRVIFHLLSGGTIIWIWFFVRYFGWEPGAQHFMFPLMVVSFFATYDNLRGKLIYTLCLLAFRMYLFLFVSKAEPVYQLNEAAELAFQMLNMCTLFTIMFYVSWTFSSTNQEAEKKLAFYNKRLQQEARTDALTGLWNRRSMMEYLEKRTQAEENDFFSVAIGDIDFFKRINDTRGHNCGDEVLRRLGSLFLEFMKERGMVCRWGGEEFFFAIPENGDMARFHIDELRNRVQNLIITDPDTKEEFSVTMTFGVEEYDFSSTVTELIKRADDKLYIGKDQGRNRTIY